jgi:hypothetical protein
MLLNHALALTRNLAQFGVRLRLRARLREL